MTPFERAALAAKQAGPDKCKTWRRGYQDCWLGVPQTTFTTPTVSVSQVLAYADGYRECESDVCIMLVDFTGLGVPPVAAARAISKAIEQVKSAQLEDTIADHDRGVEEYRAFRDRSVEAEA